MGEILQDIRKELKENVDIRTKTTVKHFFKEKVKVYGVKTAIVTKIAKKYFNEIKDRDKSDVFDLCEELFRSGYMEESFIACNWSYGLHTKFELEDFEIFEKWVKTYISNWASCDTLCNHTIGAVIEKFPKYVGDLKKWAKSDNLWMRRASAVSLIIPAKRGEFLEQAFEISTLLISDKEDLVQKGYGWLLKEESRKHQKEVFDYVMRNKSKMPRTALRYAIELLPKGLKVRAMEK